MKTAECWKVGRTGKIIVTIDCFSKYAVLLMFCNKHAIVCTKPFIGTFMFDLLQKIMKTDKKVHLLCGPTDNTHCCSGSLEPAKFKSRSYLRIWRCPWRLTYRISPWSWHMRLQYSPFDSWSRLHLMQQELHRNISLVLYEILHSIFQNFVLQYRDLIFCPDFWMINREIYEVCGITHRSWTTTGIYHKTNCSLIVVRLGSCRCPKLAYWSTVWKVSCQYLFLTIWYLFNSTSITSGRISDCYD